MVIPGRRNRMFVGVLLSAAIFFAHYLLPAKRDTLYPAESGIVALYGYTDAKTGTSARWTDARHKEWHCEYLVTHEYGCGWDIRWDPFVTQGKDFRDYDAIEYTIAYEGSASRVRLSLRIFDPDYAQTNDVHSTKFQSATVPVSELNKPVVVNLSEFTVASWWLRQRNARRQWSLPQFDNVVVVGVDIFEPGVHKVQVEKIVLVTEWIKTDTLLVTLLSFWMLVFLGSGLVSFFRLYRRAQYERHLVTILEARQNRMEAERQDLRELTDLDPLTGIYNRAGLEPFIRQVFGNTGTAVELGAMLMDIDHFKQLNNTWGHDMGDRVLRAFAAAIAANLREEDLFARWDGEKFLVICRNRTNETLLQFAEKLREITAGYTFGGEFELKITVSIGTTMAQKGERFEVVMHRLNDALLHAKEGGRNRVEFVA